MRTAIEFRPNAQAETLEAFDWYEKEEPGLGWLFREALEEKIEVIARRPSIFQRIDNSRYRRAVLETFPFIIIFTEEEDTLVVVSVFHTSRNPIVWRGRID